MKLILGVNDIPYNERPSGRKRKKVKPSQVTTGDVAGWLEKKYHVMGHFFELHQKDIAKQLEKILQGQLENLFLGAPPQANMFGEVESDTQQLFQKFIDMKEMDRLGIKGVPTKASLKGISHRFKNKRGIPGRPSFQDTSLYESSFRAKFKP